jgi:hypothetical protein
MDCHLKAIAHLDDLFIKLDSANFEIDTDSGEVPIRVRIVGETKHQARLADA